LEQEGLIEPSGRRGFVVRAIDASETLHLYEAREAVEGFAARRVAEIGKPAIDHVQSIIKSASAVDMTDARAVFETNMGIHRSVVVACENPALLDVFDEIWQRARALVTFADYLARQQNQQPLDKGHMPLVRAFRKGPDMAFEAMRDHIRTGESVHHS
jgi:DNA-binding GntR family transcriptional regulator